MGWIQWIGEWLRLLATVYVLVGVCYLFVNEGAGRRRHWSLVIAAAIGVVGWPMAAA